PNERFVVVEDVVTRGGRVQETIDIVHAHGGIVFAVGVIVDRSGAIKPDFGCPFVSLIEMNVETFPAEKLPPALAKIPAVKPVSKQIGQGPLGRCWCAAHCRQRVDEGMRLCPRLPAPTASQGASP